MTAGLWSYWSHTREEKVMAMGPDTTVSQPRESPALTHHARCIAYPVILHNWFLLPKSALLKATLFWCLQRHLAKGEELSICNEQFSKSALKSVSDSLH